MTEQMKLGAPRIFQLTDEGRQCPICSQMANRYSSAYPSNDQFFRDLVVTWCDRCGSGWVPDAMRVMAEYYATSYAGISGKNRQVDPSEVFAPAALSSDKRFARAKAQADALRAVSAKLDTVYDFGFGLGFFLFAANARSRLGFEIDPQTEPFAQYLSIEVISPWNVPQSTVDSLLTSHSTEHIEVENLDKHIASFFAMLRPGGTLAVEVPHAALSWIDKKGTHRPHTLFFSAEGLERLFVRHGFSVATRGFAADGPVAPLLEQRIYWPRNDDSFFSSRNSSALFVIFRK